MRYKIDAMSLREGVLELDGWAIPRKGGSIIYEVTDAAGKPLSHKLVVRERVDVARQFDTDAMCGFTLTMPFAREDEILFVMRDGKQKRSVRVNAGVVEQRRLVKTRKREKLLALCQPETLQVCMEVLKRDGMRVLWHKAVHKLRAIEEDYDYPEWQSKLAFTEAQLRQQREAWRTFSFAGGKAPLISIVIPAYNTPKKYLGMLFDSLCAQTYPNFEVIVADGSEANDNVCEVTERRAAEDARFRYLNLGGNRGISGNTNAGLAEAKGDYIALCDHDDELPPHALYEVVRTIADCPDAALIYTDEDKVDFDGKALFEPHFKSDYNPELLTTVNYICHLSVIRRDLLEEAGGFRAEYDGAQDYDFFLRCCEIATREERARLKTYEAALKKIGVDAAKAEDEAAVEKLCAETGFRKEAVKKLLAGRFTSECVVHIPCVCYHWRCHKNSTASDPKAKLYAFDAGARAILDHDKRENIPALQVETGVTYGFYHTRFADGDELVSVIIPNKDHAEDLDQCIRSLISRSTHRRFEIIVVENNSTEPETFAYYEKIDGHPEYFLTEAAAQDGQENAYAEAEQTERARCDVSGISIKIVRWAREFNYSAINNFGVEAAHGDYLLFLNNDVELIGEDSISEMLAYARQPEIGIVGARLLYGDDTVQHAGVLVGLGGIAGAVFVGLHEKENSYMHRMMSVQDYSAVTAACLMTRRETFLAAGGFEETLAVAFNDIDYCMKVRKLGLRCVYNPYVTFHHYESKSRGLEDTPEKVQRFNGEIAVFASRWGEILAAGDPYYNPNLTLRKTNFALRDLNHEKPGEPFKLELDVDKQLKIVLAEKARRENRQGG